MIEVLLDRSVQEENFMNHSLRGNMQIRKNVGAGHYQQLEISLTSLVLFRNERILMLFNQILRLFSLLSFTI